MKSLSFFFLTTSLLLSGFQSLARSAADVVFYHYRASLHDSHMDKYSLFPKEPSISNFPRPISENETDLAVLHRYYKDVAHAYEGYLQTTVKPKLIEYKEKMIGQRQSLHLTQTRSPSGKNQFSRSLTDGRGETKGQDRIDQTARIRAIAYYSTTFKALSDDAATLEKKAEFYGELSETSEELYRGDIH